jgi:hypothetical protein
MKETGLLYTPEKYRKCTETGKEYWIGLYRVVTP